MTVLQQIAASRVSSGLVLRFPFPPRFSSSTLQHVVDSQVFPHQSHAAIENVSGLLGADARAAAVPHAIEPGQVAVHGLQGVTRLPRHLVARFAFRVAFPADDALVRQAGADVVQRGTASGAVIQHAPADPAMLAPPTVFAA